MHHRRNRTTRREVHRLDHKRVRANERQVLEGGRVSNPRGYDSWGRSTQSILLDGETGGPKPKKPRPKKERCPKNRVHEWYKEVLTETSRYWQHYRWDRETNEWTYQRVETVKTIRVQTCIHCWKVKKVSRWKDTTRTLLDEFKTMPRSLSWWERIY